MPLVLSVLGAAFGLPSIDAECAAAAALLKLHFGDDQQAWSIKSTHESPELLPMLVDGDVSISGFSSICDHLGTNRKSHKSDADAVATMALIQARAPVLIAAYLYLSYENYSTTTRPAFTPILPLYSRFIIPGAFRSAAKESTKQFDIANLDIEELDDKHSPSDQKLGAAESSFEASSKDRASLLLPKVKTVRGLLAQKPETMAAFKLQNLADALLEPLQELLGEEAFLAGTRKPGQVDCLAFAYLSLMLRPAVPQQWLRKIIHMRYSKLEAYVERMEAHLGFGSAVKIQVALPWTTPVSISLHGVLADISSLVRDQSTTTTSPAVTSSTELDSPFISRHLPAILFTAGSALVAGASWVLLPLLNAPHGDPVQIFGGRQVPDLGHLSNALAGLSLALPGQDLVSETHVISDNEAPARVGIEIEP